MQTAQPHMRSLQFAFVNLHGLYHFSVFFASHTYFKVVICGKYKNINKITKIERISLKFDTILICSLQCKIEGYAV